MRIGVTRWLLVGLLAAGCAANPRVSSSATSGGRSRPVAELEPLRDYSPKAVEERTEAQARFATGYLHDLNDESDQAAADYLQAGLADVGNEELVLELVGRLLRFKKTDQARELLTKATAQPEASGVLYAQLGLVYALSGMKTEAIQANRTAIAKAPRLLAGYRHLAQLYFQEHQPEEGLAVLDQAAKQPDTDAHFLAELGEFYLAFAQGGTTAAKDRAKDVFERAVRMKPTHPLVLQKLADGFVYLGDTDKAAELFEKLLEQFPHFPGIREKLADLFLRNQDYKHAADQLQSIVKNNPTDPRAYYLLGSIAYEAKDMPRAAECFGKVKLLNPNFEPAYYDLAGAQISQDQSARALETLAEARQKFKPNFICEFYSGLAYGRLKDYRRSIQHFIAAEVVARASETNRLNHLFFFQLGAAYERNQQYEEAAASFHRCLELAPDFGEALNYLGYMWAERGENLEEARQMIEKAVQQEPKNAAYLDSLGWVLFRLNRPEDALKYLLQAIEHSEKPDATLHDHLGDVYLAVKQPEKARAAWQKALTLEPDDHGDAIRKKLEALPGTAGTAGTAGTDKAK